MINQAYSRHTPEELEAVRAALEAPYRRAFLRQRIESQTQRVSIMLDNVRFRLWEISDLVDAASGCNDATKVSYRDLIETLRAAEVNLEAAVGRLAASLDLVQTPVIA
jgi:hypothetical protein